MVSQQAEMKRLSERVGRGHACCHACPHRPHRGTSKSKAEEYRDGALNGPCMHHAWTMGGIRPDTPPQKIQAHPLTYLIVSNLVNKLYNSNCIRNITLHTLLK